MEKELTLKLNKGYKQFKTGFECNFKGNLIILSGVNGSGKTQLIDILSKESDIYNPLEKGISVEEWRNRYGMATVSINNQELTVAHISKRSFKENIKIENITEPNLRNKSWYKEEAWRYYSYIINWNDSYFKKSKAFVQKIVLENGFKKRNEYSNEVDITKEQFMRILPEDFVWEEDDLFLNTISQIFYDFAAKRNIEEAKCGREKGGFDNENYIKVAPWTILNEVFEELKFNYRFKRDYEFETPNLKELPVLYPINKNGEIDEKSPRQLIELSDGEKSIISLTFAILNEEKRPVEKLLLLDEFDNTLNPSLIESLYIVIDKFFIQRGVTVVMSTHSPVTISLAPEYASFYELFRQDNNSPKIMAVQKEEYTELKIANQEYYKKIANQEKRIEELEKTKVELENLTTRQKPLLVVEDKYTQIYKIAYLKLNNIKFKKDNIDEKFDKYAKFEICSQEGCSGVAGLINCSNLDIFSKPIIGLFDYDKEGVEKYKGCNRFSICKEDDANKGIYKKRKDYECYALLLPVPERLKSYVQKIKHENIANNYFEIEHYLPEEFIKNSRCFEKKVILGQDLYVCCKDKKTDLWKELIELDKEKFSDFKILFKKIKELFKL